MRATPEFKTLERNINEFLVSTQFYPRDHPGDDYAPFIACLPHVARILAHEPLITNSANDKSMLLSADSARRIQATIDWPESKSLAPELLPFLTFVSANASQMRGGAGVDPLLTFPVLDHCWSLHDSPSRFEAGLERSSRRSEYHRRSASAVGPHSVIRVLTCW